jgi:hypothetical protein
VLNACFGGPLCNVAGLTGASSPDPSASRPYSPKCPEEAAFWEVRYEVISEPLFNPILALSSALVSYPTPQDSHVAAPFVRAGF